MRSGATLTKVRSLLQFWKHVTCSTNENVVLTRQFILKTTIEKCLCEQQNCLTFLTVNYLQFYKLRIPKVLLHPAKSLVHLTKF